MCSVRTRTRIETRTHAVRGSMVSRQGRGQPARNLHGASGGLVQRAVAVVVVGGGSEDEE